MRVYGTRAPEIIALANTPEMRAAYDNIGKSVDVSAAFSGPLSASAEAGAVES